MWTKFLNWFLGNKVTAMNNMKFTTPVGNHANGDILLGFGNHEIKIVIDQKPCTVFLTIEDPTGGIAVCQGNVNKIGVRILDDGFILYANIHSNTALVKWTC